MQKLQDIGGYKVHLESDNETYVVGESIRFKFKHENGQVQVKNGIVGVELAFNDKVISQDEAYKIVTSVVDGLLQNYEKGTQEDSVKEDY